MAVTLTLVGEHISGAAREWYRAATAELTNALAETAPRACAAGVVVARDGDDLQFRNPRITVESVPLPRVTLPTAWRTGLTARPFDGMFVHALTPLAPMRIRRVDDGSQVSVTVPNTLAWEDTASQKAGERRAFRSYLRRALSRADAIVTLDYATASKLEELVGQPVSATVIPLASPAEFVVRDSQPTETGVKLARYVGGEHPHTEDQVVAKGLTTAERDARATELDLPERFLVTNAALGDFGRLAWLADAVLENGDLPPLIVIDGSGKWVADQVDETAEAPASDEGSSAGDESASEANDAAADTDTSADENAVANVEADATAEVATASADSGEETSSDTASGDGSTVQDTNPDDDSLTELERLEKNSDGRIRIIRPELMTDIGVLLSLADALVLPQQAIGTPFLVYGALANHLPVVHASLEPVDEIVIDAGATFTDKDTLVSALREHIVNDETRERLSIFAKDRAGAYSWRATAAALWELHANI